MSFVPTLLCGRFELPLSRPLLMGIVNVTPDSFSDGGRYCAVDAAIAHARQLLADGADLLDIGGESTRPGAAQVSEDEECRRVLPVLEALRELRVPLSIDTRKPAVMHRALAVGVDMVNDISALSAPGALAAVAGSQAALCLMHMQGDPQTMQAEPQYNDVLAEVMTYLSARRAAALAAGIAKERLVLDPGFGFGKTLQHNLLLLQQLAEFKSLRTPLLVGVSRKSMLGAITGRPVAERVAASVSAAMLAVQRGAAIVRVHDVAATKDMLQVLAAAG